MSNFNDDVRKEYVLQMLGGDNDHHSNLVSLMDSHMITWLIIKAYAEPMPQLVNPRPHSVFRVDTDIYLTELGKIWLGLYDDANDTEPPAEVDSAEPRYMAMWENKLIDYEGRRVPFSRPIVWDNELQKIHSVAPDKIHADDEADSLNALIADEKLRTSEDASDTEPDAEDETEYTVTDWHGGADIKLGDKLVCKFHNSMWMSSREITDLLNTETEALRERIAALEDVINRAVNYIYANVSVKEIPKGEVLHDVFMQLLPHSDHAPDTD